MRRAGGVRGGRLGRPALWAWTALAVPAPGIGMMSPAAHGSHPYGTWIVRRIVVDAGWRAWRNPNRDVAFLVVGRPGRPGVQDRTGGERLTSPRPVAPPG